MKVKFLDNILFRIMTPPLVAFVVYLWILLIFDRLSELIDNFSTEEFLLLIILSYLLFETYRTWLKSSQRLLSSIKGSLVTNVIQIIGNLIISIGVVSFGFMIYFNYILGINEYSRELITFLLVFSVVGLLFHLFYMSISFLDKQHALLLKKEQINRKNIEYELTVFRNHINPNFLYRSLEGVITLLRNKHVDHAEEHIDHLALYYRNILGNRYSEIIPISQEREIIKHYLHLQNFKYDDQLSILWKEQEDIDIKVVPNTILKGIQLLEATQIIDAHNKLEIFTEITDIYLIFRYRPTPRLISSEDATELLESLERALQFYTDQKVEWIQDSPVASLAIPIIKTKEEPG